MASVPEESSYLRKISLNCVRFKRAFPWFRLSVHLNGEKLCSVGLPPEDWRGINVVWFGRFEEREEDLGYLWIAGSDGDETVDWPDRELRLGDEVTIKITEDSAPMRLLSGRTLSSSTANIAPWQSPQQAPQSAGKVPLDVADRASAFHHFPISYMSTA